MFDIFKTRESQQIESGRNLGEYASIEPLIQRCRYSGFIIQVHGYRFDELAESIRARDAFMLAIDQRIQNQDFTDFIIHQTSSEPDYPNAPRVVFDTRGKVLMSWHGTQCIREGAQPSP